MEGVYVSVDIRDTTICIPTYEPGEPDRNPQFIEKRVYQGSTGKVYPYPVVETLSDKRVDRMWRAVVIRNEYLEVTVLPELGGRIQYATDLTNGYDFVYRNDVIKPALVGLLGPWISGGIEFNWPQHHRPTTFMPVDYRIIELQDGGRGVQCHDVDQMYGTEVVTTIALHPQRAYIEITAELFNGTDLPQTFLWWANPAVPVNDETKTVMPPDVHAVMDHGKRDVSRYPIATGTYYKHDYAAGVDIGRYKNVPVPTSYMAAASSYDFVGGYDFGRRAGILHYADHHVSPGKKQWTWGNGDFGRAWDRNLTDENGPYVELMTGVFTDNQPDFTWLKPHESKTFTQYFMPYKDAGLVKNATLDAAVNLEIGPADPARSGGEAHGIEAEGLARGEVRVSVYATRPLEGAVVEVVDASSTVLYEVTCDLSPAATLVDVFAVDEHTAPQDLTVRVCHEGAPVVSYTPEPDQPGRLPEPAQAAADPAQIPTCEELLLTAQHLEQYRHATYLPDPYYLEGLKRDPGDARINTAYGELLLRRGDAKGAAKHFRRAIERLTQRNPNPYDASAYRNLGIAELRLGNLDAAYDAFYKATWDDAQQEQGFFYLAVIDARRGKWAQALEFCRRARRRNTDNLHARALEAYVLRRAGDAEGALRAVRDTLAHHAFEFVSGFELSIATGDDTVVALMRGTVENHLKAARVYMLFGAYDEALHVLDRIDCVHPLVCYYRAWLLDAQGRADEAERALACAEQADSSYCFPNHLDDIAVLQHAIDRGARAMAPYYLGCLFYDKLQAERAIELWELARAGAPQFPTVHRNLALAYFNKRHDREAARASMERAFALNESDARVLLELDQLHRALGWSFAQRREMLERHLAVVEQRDDLYIEYLTLLNMTGAHVEALERMARRHFHPWEGGEGKITTQYRCALMLCAKDALAAGEHRRAIEHLTAALSYPENLGEGKLEGQTDNDLHYLLGCAHAALGEQAAARREFELATRGVGEVGGAMYYNDQPAEMVLYRGLAHRALGDASRANACFYRLLDFGEQHIDDEMRIEYFAVSLPDFLIFERDLNRMNRVHCLYVMALAALGIGDAPRAAELLAQALELDPGHAQAALFLDEVERRKVLARASDVA